MFSAGIGVTDGIHTTKYTPSPPMLVAKIGGPTYRIGIGGGAASSRLSSSVLDFDAVQREGMRGWGIGLCGLHELAVIFRIKTLF